MTHPTPLSQNRNLDSFSNEELAQALAERLAISPADWHRLKANRQAQAGQHLGAALVSLLQGNDPQTITHLQKAIAWLDHSISAPPCPTHGNHNSPQKKG